MSRYLPLFVIALIVVIVFSSNSVNPQLGRTGSPGDGGSTCTFCHAGTATAKTGWIQADIPASGYVPGAVYNVTATVTELGRSKFGFEATVEDSQNNKVGALTAGTGSAVSSNYVRHTTGGNSGTDTKSWIFSWTAPSTGVGDITFYGAFNAANGNVATSGDIIFTSSTSYIENVGTAIQTALAEENSFVIYPNPAHEFVNVSFDESNGKEVNITFYDIKGSKIKTISKINSGLPMKCDISTLGKGLYFITADIGREPVVQRLLIQ